jgi:nitronate monooxygenase
LLIGWPWRENDINVSLSDEAKRQYLFLFQKQISDVAEAPKKFSSFYHKWFNRHQLVVPTTFVAFVTLWQSYLIGETAFAYLYSDLAHYTRLDITAEAGFVGAYIFVTWDFIVRNRQRDLTSSDILKGALRIGTGISVGYAFSSLVKPEIGPFVAFAVGVFPLQTIQVFLRRTVSERLGIQLPGDQSKDKDAVINLSGVNTEIAERIAEADISTILQLAYCDPIQLTMQTNLSFNFINDIVSEALAWIYLEDKLNLIRSYGLRTAFEIRSLQDGRCSTDPDEKKLAETVLQKAADAVNMSVDALSFAFNQIAYDPYTDFLMNVFKDGSHANPDISRQMQEIPAFAASASRNSKSALPENMQHMSLPVIGAPLFIISNPDLVIAQCKNGVVGSFPALNARPKELLDEWLARITSELASYRLANPQAEIAPFAVNQIVHGTNERLAHDLDLCAKYKVPMIITSLSAPTEIVPKVHEWGGVVFHDVINVRHAEKAIDAGVDGLILVCAGAGGHAGTQSPFALVQEVRKFWSGPIALSGAITTGRAVLAARVIGADFAYVGTRFIATDEANADPKYKQMIVDSAAADIMYSPYFTGVHGNYLRPSVVNAGLDPETLPDRDKTTMSFDAEKQAEKVKAWRDVWGAGQGVGTIEDVRPTAEVIAKMRSEFQAAKKELAAI